MTLYRLVATLVMQGLAFAMWRAYMDAIEELKKWQAYYAKAHAMTQEVAKCQQQYCLHALPSAGLVRYLRCLHCKCGQGLGLG